MVGAAAELPSVQIHGPVGLGRGRTQVRHHPEELGTGTLSPMGPTGPRLPGPGPGPQTENSTGLSRAQEGGLGGHREPQGRRLWARPQLGMCLSLVFLSAEQL